MVNKTWFLNATTLPSYWDARWRLKNTPSKSEKRSLKYKEMAPKRCPAHYTTHRIQVKASVKQKEARCFPQEATRVNMKKMIWSDEIYYIAKHCTSNAPSTPWNRGQHHVLVWNIEGKHGCRKLSLTQKDNLKMIHFTAKQWPQANTAKLPLCKGNGANVPERPCQSPDLDLV